MTSDAVTLRRASLEVLRAEAQDELGSVVFERLRGGQDPWAFMSELPTIDELVVLLLRTDLVEAAGLHRVSRDADKGFLARIAEAYPGLAPTVTEMLERIDRLRWSA